MAPRPSITDAPQKRNKVTAALNQREWDAVDYVLDVTARAGDLAALNPDDKPTVTADLSEKERAEQVDRIAEYELRAELKAMFGTLDLPTDQTNVTRFALRYLAKSIKGARTRAGLRAAEADPVSAENAGQWLRASAQELISSTDDDEVASDDDRPLTVVPTVDKDDVAVYVAGSFELAQRWAEAETVLTGALNSGLLEQIQLVTTALHKIDLTAVRNYAATTSGDESER